MRILITIICITSILFAESNPVIDYSSITESKLPQKKINIYYLRYISVTQLTPLLRVICNECNWYLDHEAQSVGLYIDKESWRQYRLAIRQVDRNAPMVRLNLDVIEVSDIQNKSYQQLFHKLSQPITVANTSQLLMEIDYMLSSGNASLLSSPVIISSSGHEAMISVGDRIPYATAISTSGTTSRRLEYIDTGVDVHVTPFIHSNNQIDLELKLNYKTVTGYRIENQHEMPILASRSTQMRMQVTSNATIIFAGLMDQSNHAALETLPLIGDLPIIGGLFRRTVNKKRTSDIIYKLTATLVN